MYTENLHKKLREITNKHYGFYIRERIGYFDDRVFSFGAVSELLDEIERLNEDIKELKDTHEKQND